MCDIWEKWVSGWRDQIPLPRHSEPFELEGLPLRLEFTHLTKKEDPLIYMGRTGVPHMGASSLTLQKKKIH